MSTTTVKPSVKDLADEFLAHRRIAVAGVSSTTQDAANLIYNTLRKRGYHVFAVNPKVDTIEGDPCYPNLKAIPNEIDGVVIVTRPEVTETIVRECAELGIKHVWMHRAFGNSVSESAVQFCREHDIEVIDGGCPMMYCQPVDFGHKCIRAMMHLVGRMPHPSPN